ncbi:MAG: class I SAM-dependent methyltransferase, partial [Actinobacteria bacterium]|nr:class I SAM-dependent methyltransferase [Actinomycetota bacterium]
MTTPVVDPAIEAYAAAHTTAPSDHLLKVAEATRSAEGGMSRMMVGALEGRFLEFLVFMTGARRIVEIGTFTGYSALSMAEALPDDGRIVTCEFDPKRAEMARSHFDASPHAAKIEVRVGPAVDTIAALDGPFDLVFIDADKPNYSNYYEAVLPKLADDGLIAADNTLWSGQVIDDKDDSEGTVAIRRFNDAVAADNRVICVQLTVRDGVTL